MREIKFQYICKHSYKGDEIFFKKVYALEDLEHMVDDAIEDVAQTVCGCCDGASCLNESKSYCECDSILDYGEFDIVARRPYTGIKDCNSVEVYDGDVINAKHAHKGNIKGVVELSEYEDNEQYIDETHLGWNVNGIPLVDLINEGAVIIGNIHENPELLEGK